MANFHVDSSGNLWLGDTSTTFTTSAPFYVQSDGTVKATSGTIGDISITSSSIQSSNFSGSNGFQLNSDGSAIFRSVTISGYATSSEVSTAQSTANSAATAASNAQSTANDADSTASSAQSTANSVDGTVGTLQSNLFYGGTTEINGGTIRTGTLSADKITAGTMSADRISGGTINGTLIGGGSINMTYNITTSMAISAASGNITNGLSVGSLDSSGTVEGSQFKSTSNSSVVGFGSSDVYLRGGGTTDFAAGDNNVSYQLLRPSSDNTKDLGNSSNRWRRVYRLYESSASDQRLKENISDLSYGLDFINNLEPKEFTWKSWSAGFTEDGDEIFTEAGENYVFGFLAQDMENYIDDSKTYELLNYEEDNDTYNYSSSNMIAPLVKAVQELSTQVSDLTARIEALEG